MPLSTSWTYFKFIYIQRERRKHQNFHNELWNMPCWINLGFLIGKCYLSIPFTDSYKLTDFMAFTDFVFKVTKTYCRYLNNFFLIHFQKWPLMVNVIKKKGNQIACKGVLRRKVNSCQKMWMKTAHNLDEKFKVFLHSRYFKRHIFYFSKHLKK